MLRDTVSTQATKVGFSVSLDAQFDSVTQLEQEKLAKQQFENELHFTVDVNLTESKKAFLNFIKGLDDSAVYGKLWDLQPHNPHTYEAPIGKLFDTIIAN